MKLKSTSHWQDITSPWVLWSGLPCLGQRLWVEAIWENPQILLITSSQLYHV